MPSQPAESVESKKSGPVSVRSSWLLSVLGNPNIRLGTFLFMLIGFGLCLSGASALMTATTGFGAIALLIGIGLSVFGLGGFGFFAGKQNTEPKKAHIPAPSRETDSVTESSSVLPLAGPDTQGH